MAVCRSVFSPHSDLFGTLFLRSGTTFSTHPAPSFPLTHLEKIYTIMQPFAFLFLTANLAVSALAAPIANTTNLTSSSSSCARPPSATNPSTTNFLNGTNVGEGGFSLIIARQFDSNNESWCYCRYLVHAWSRCLRLRE
jgi:hypothetical protein